MVANPADPAWTEIFEQQGALLTFTDRVALDCVKSGQIFPTEWLTYTTALKAVTAQTDPTNIIWPTQPSMPTNLP